MEPWAHLKDDELEGEAHLALSREMAEETLVLLQNRGGILPLDPSARIALLGPNADDREMPAAAATVSVTHRGPV